MADAATDMAASRYDVVGLGTALVDYIGVVPHYPPADSQLELQSLECQGGGNVSTTLATVARLGGRTCYLGKLGDDQFSHQTLAGLREVGVDVSHVLIEPGASTGFAFIIVEAGTGRRTILWSKQGKPRFAAPEVDGQLVQSGRILHLDEYATEAAIAAAQIAHGNEHVTVSLDAETGLDGIETLLSLADIVTASHDFALAYSDAPDYRTAARYMHRHLPAGIVIVTAGDQGSYCVSGEGEFQQPAFVVEAVDTTGSGDVFRGAFCFYLLQGRNLVQCAEFASAAAALNCRTMGGRAGLPDLGEVQRFLLERRA